MKKNYCISLLLFFTVYSSFSQTDSSENWKIEVEDPGMYDIGFINHWNYVRPYTVRFNADSIIVGGNKNDAILLPTDLPLNEIVEYECIKQDTTYLMQIRRLNYTNIEFTIIQTITNVSDIKAKSISILESTFYNGAEGVYETEDKTYGMNDYNFTIDNDRTGSLLIPDGTDEMIGYSEYDTKSELHLRFMKKKINNCNRQRPTPLK